MAIATEITIDATKIAPLFEEGVRRATATGQAIMVSYTQAMPEADPLYFFAERQKAGVNAFYWEHPADNFAIAGSGSAYVVSGEGEQRFEQAEAAWHNLLDDAVIGGTVQEERGTGPILMGGFAFDPMRPSTELWEGFGDGRLVLPRLQLTRTAQGTFLTINALMETGDDADVLARQAAHFYREPAALSFENTSNSLQLKDIRPAEEWKAVVAEAVRQMHKGDFQKVVLAREVRVVAQNPFEAGAVLEQLRRNFPDATVFAVAREGRAFVGATPERLVQLRDGQVRTAGLAGTIGRGATPEEDERLGQELLHSEKNQAEHAIVVDIIYAALKKICVSLYLGEPPRLLKLRNLQHLYTPIVGRLRERSTILKLVEALHPTPALGGYPRVEALEFIREHEGLDRGWYGAPLGWVDRRGEGEFVVAIRSALLDEQGATLFAGCGIVADSTPDNEYKESCVKLRAMLSALEAAS